MPIHTLTKLNFILGPQSEYIVASVMGSMVGVRLMLVKLISLPGSYSVNGSEMNKYMQVTGLCTNCSLSASYTGLSFSIENLSILQNLGDLKRQSLGQ